jgi:hypothetical protein
MEELSPARAGLKRNSAHAEMIRRLRLADLRKLLRDRCGPTLPNDDAGEEYLIELLLPISVGSNADIKMRNAVETWAPWMSKQEAAELIEQINRMPIYERKPKARTLGERLNVPYGERARLRLRTIGPCDVTEKGMELLRKKKKRERMRRLRQRKPRADYLAAHSVNRTKPWVALGISRRAYYYRLKQTNCTSVCPLNLTKVEHIPVQSEKRRVSKEAVAVKSGHHPTSIETTSKAEKTEMPVTDTARELLAHTCANQEEQSGTDLRGMPADLSKFYAPMPTYEWLNSAAENLDRAA